MRTIRFEFSEVSSQQQRLRLFDGADQLIDSRSLEASTLDVIVERAEAEYQQPLPESLLTLGQALYDFLDGDERWLAGEQETPRKALQIRVDVGGRLAHLPWELLSDQAASLCSFVHGGILPVRQVGREKQPRETKNRPLRLRLD